MAKDNQHELDSSRPQSNKAKNEKIQADRKAHREKIEKQTAIDMKNGAAARKRQAEEKKARIDSKTDSQTD